MRVLHVIPSLSTVHGGPTEALKVIEHGLCTHGIDVTVLTTDDDGPASRFERNSYPVSTTGVERVYCRKWFDAYKFAPGALFWLQRYLQDFNVVHIHALFSFTSTASAIVAHREGVPYIIRPLGTLTKYGIEKRRPLLKRLSLNLLERRILKNAAAVHFTSKMEMEEAEALDVPFRGIVIPLGVDRLIMRSAKDLRCEYPGLRGRTVLLYLSRLDPKKNVENLLKAVAALKPEQNAVTLLMAGGGDPDYAAGLKSLATSLGLADNVIWLGRVEGEDKYAALAAADLFVLPSLSENFGIAAAEALLAGLPCVLGRGVALAAEIEAAGAALIVAPDARSIAKGIETLMRDAARRKAMGLRGRVFAESSYSQPAITNRLIDLYHAVGRQPIAPTGS